MPQLSQGDIFEAASRVQLAIVFGHVGFNEMRQCWVAFAARHDQLSVVRDPFAELAGRAIEWSPGRWIWFVAEQQNHGMTNAQLTAALDAALFWASQQGLKSVATNGVANTDHGHDTASNRQSDDERAAMLINYAERAERERHLALDLVSLNDVFTRHRR